MNTLKGKLAAILSADVAGYSRLMDDDEEATIRSFDRLMDLNEIVFAETFHQKKRGGKKWLSGKNLPRK